MKIKLNSVMTDDQEKTPRCSTGIPGSVRMKDNPATAVLSGDTRGNLNNLCQPE